MGVVANFAQQVFSGIRDIGIQIWNGIRNVGEVIGNTVVGFVNGIQTLIKRISLVQITSFVLLLALFTPEILLLPLLFISDLILFGKIFLWQDHLCDNNNEENQNIQILGDNNQNIQILGDNNQNIQILGDNNQNLNEEPRERDIDLTNVFLENTKSYINDIRNILGYEQRTNFLYTFTLENDDIVVRQQNQSESDSELNNRVSNVLLSYVTYEVINNNENTLISLSFANEIEDIELGRRILRRIKDQLNRNYPNQVRVVETLDDPIEVEIEQIKDIHTILMVITI